VNTNPTRHETETTETTSNTKSTLTTEFDGDQTEWFITGWDEGKVSTTEQVRWEGSELGLGEDAIREHFHETGKLLRSEPAVKIDDRSDGNELDARVLGKTTGLSEEGQKGVRNASLQSGHNISDNIDTLLL
jgi:hypothetical protein